MFNLTRQQMRFLVAAFVVRKGNDFDQVEAAKMIDMNEESAEATVGVLDDRGLIVAGGYNDSPSTLTPSGIGYAEELIDEGYGEGIL
jgi:hypothetical protein